MSENQYIITISAKESSFRLDQEIAQLEDRDELKFEKMESFLVCDFTHAILVS